MSFIHYTRYAILIHINIQTYKKATIFFSHDTASIAAVIPAMDKLDSHLNPHTKRPYHSAIQAAMKLAQKKINCYYLMTNLSSAYRIAMGKSVIFFIVYSPLTFIFSPPSWPQACVFPSTGVGRRMD